ncbi:MAG: type II toxin-antitoxin system PemK/MazF family toxin [Alphaproteobacteria bacterium]|nr:type II toxin-antitoxin system PemK/MazF family toxin [Alphaproteobacteria bacterium]
MRVPDRGEVWWLSLDPIAGHEQAGRRPCLVLTERSFNEASGLAIIAPLTTKPKGYATEVPAPKGDLQRVILCHQLRTVAWRDREAAFDGAVGPAVMQRVAATTKRLLRLG